jgi:ABC-type nickel/cobalt efflux system permease component RcnA
MIVLLLLLVLLAVTGALTFVLKVALGVALGLILAIVIAGSLMAWRVRRMLFGRRPRWRRVRGSSSHIEVLDRERRPQDL